VIEKKIKILIVEDEAITGIFLKEKLSLSNFEIQGIAPSSREAVRLFARCKPDMVLMDVMLAGEIDGIETAKILQKKQPDVPIIFMTGYDDEETRNSALSLHPLSFVVKPVDTETIRELADGYFSQK
jgi:two-component system, response regulator PdtaR